MFKVPTFLYFPSLQHCTCPNLKRAAREKPLSAALAPRFFSLLSRGPLHPATWPDVNVVKPESEEYRTQSEPWQGGSLLLDFASKLVQGVPKMVLQGLPGPRTRSCRPASLGRTSTTSTCASRRSTAPPKNPTVTVA